MNDSVMNAADITIGFRLEKKFFSRFLKKKLIGDFVLQPVSPIGDDEGMFNSISLGRFELVRRRQLAQLQRRSNWFLAAPCSVQIDSRVLLHKLDMEVAAQERSATGDVDSENKENIRGESQFDKPFSLQEHDQDREFTEKDRRYFMLERWYNGESQEAPK